MRFLYFRKDNSMKDVKIGTKIMIVSMKDEPHYSGRFGVVTHIDDAGQIHGTWGGCALIPGIDTYYILEEKDTEKKG